MLAAVVVCGAIIVFAISSMPARREPRTRVEAKNIVNQICIALNAYYAEYGAWPTGNGAEKSSRDLWFGDTAPGPLVPNSALFFTLRNIPKGPNETFKLNSRRIVFHELRNVWFSKGVPRSGFFDRGPDGGPPPPELESCLFDPWGHQYGIVIDSNDDGRLDLTGIYSDFTGDKAPRKQVGAFSLGKDGKLGTNGDRTYRNREKMSDDVLSWE